MTKHTTEAASRISQSETLRVNRREALMFTTLAVASTFIAKMTPADSAPATPRAIDTEIVTELARKYGPQDTAAILLAVCIEKNVPRAELLSLDWSDLPAETQREIHAQARWLATFDEQEWGSVRRYVARALA